jgi:acyl-CoA synthetase (AMP-forming)/AMP-acid ligase II
MISPLFLPSSCKTIIDLLQYRANSSTGQSGYSFLQDESIDRLTYQALDQRARSIATLLQQYVPDPIGARALLLFAPGLDFIAAFFGCLYAGMIAVPAYPPRRNQKMERLETILRDAEAIVALTTQAIDTDIATSFVEHPELAKLQWIAIDALPDSLATSWQKPNLQANSLAFLQYTSGSTGNPKGVKVSHGNLLHNSELIQKSFGDTPDSSGVSWLPPYHDMGLIGGILQPLYVGAPMTLMSPMSFLQKPFRWLQAISQYRATTSGAPNFAFDLCLKKVTPEQRQTLDLSCWEVAFTGAEPVRSETLDRFAETFASCGFRPEAFHPCYGMAETTLIISGGQRLQLPLVRSLNAAALEQNQVTLEPGQRSFVSCGPALPGQTVVIVDPQTLQPCASDQVGEIWVASPSVAQGYWNRREETEQAFHAQLEGSNESFFRTGDLGFFLGSELFVTGRLKDIIIVRGQNHYPQDIELTVERSHSVLRSGCGAAFTHEVNAQDQLVIVQEVERTALKQLDIAEVAGTISQAITAEHGLQVGTIALIKTGSIPKTSSGKIQRRACRDKWLNQELAIVEQWQRHSSHLLLR